MRLALATCSKFPQLFEDEQALPSWFAKAGPHTAVPVVWNDPKADWKSYDAVVLRSTWDYVEHYKEFCAWLDRLESLGVPLVNSSKLVRWNLDKVYLRELEKKGVPIPPTEFLDRGARADLAKVVAARGWSEVVLKPTVSAGSRLTYRFKASEASAHQKHLDEILKDTGAMLQPFFPEIATGGELSLLFFGGDFSFGAVKVPAQGDFRSQFTHGATYKAAVPTVEIMVQARKAFNALPSKPAYARIDGVIREGGQFVLMEAELVEPYLYFPAGALLAPLHYVRAVLAGIPKK